MLTSKASTTELVARGDTLQRHAESDFGLLKIDFSNAFNQVSRSAFVQATCREFPGLANWTNWCYGEESTLLYDHREVITSSSGVQQGDPLSPLYFCFALNELVREIASLGPVYQKWYMDDGGVVAPVPVLLKVWGLLKEKGRSGSSPKRLQVRVVLAGRSEARTLSHRGSGFGPQPRSSLGSPAFSASWISSFPASRRPWIV